MPHAFVYKLIGAGTVEEKIVDLQSHGTARRGDLRKRIATAAMTWEQLFAPLEAF